MEGKVGDSVAQMASEAVECDVASTCCWSPID